MKTVPRETGDPLQPESPGSPVFGLALGGGGILGLAHVGVLEALASQGLTPGIVTGTSIGALVAGCYGGDMPITLMKDIARRFSWRSVRHRKILPTMAVYSSEPMRRYLEEVLPCRDFDSFSLPVAMVATDLRTAQMVVLGGKCLDAVDFDDEDVIVLHADVVDAIRASCTVPVLFEPIEVGGRMLVDGVLTNNVPAGLARRMGADFVMAVDLKQRRAVYDSPSNIFEYVMQSQMIYRYWAVKNRHIWADVVIRPNLAEFGWDDVSCVNEIIAAGREAVLEKIPEIKMAFAACRPPEDARGPAEQGRAQTFAAARHRERML